MQVFIYDAFTDQRGKGNPAGVVIADAAADDETMQDVAVRLGLNETVFIFQSRGKLRFRYFTPGHEINLCGHATVGGVGCLVDLGLLTGNSAVITTNIGDIAVKICRGKDRVNEITMEQGLPEFRPFTGSAPGVAAAIGIGASDLDPVLPPVYGSTGTWTLLLPVRTRDVLRRMSPQNDRFPGLLPDMPKASVHPFTLERYRQGGPVVARHFSSPFSGTVEDPVTGTASGVIGEYLMRLAPETERLRFSVEQGHEVGRPGRLTVSAERGRRVRVTGRYVMEACRTI